MKTLNLMKSDTPMRACEALTFEPAACWRRLQQAKHEFFFEDSDQLMKERHRQFLEQIIIAMDSYRHRLLGDITYDSTIHGVRHGSSIPILVIPARKE